MHPMLFMVNNVGGIIILAFIADIALKNRDPWRRSLAIIGGFPVLVVLMVILLGVWGKLSAISVSKLLGIVFVLLIAFQWKSCQRMFHAIPKTLQRNPPQWAMMKKQLLGAISLFLAVGVVAFIVGNWGIDGTRFQYDDLSYHAPVVAHWLIDESLSLAPCNYHAYYPFNAEILSLWFMLPFRQDALASLAGAYWVALMISAIISLGLSTGYSKTTILLSSVLSVASPVIQSAVRTFSATDLAAPAMVLAAIAMASPGKASSPSQRRGSDALYSGLFAGFALGCKIAFAPVCLILFLWWLFHSEDKTSFRIRAGYTLLFLFGAIVTGSFWYGRNWVLTGNPIFPAELGPFHGPFSAEPQVRTKLLSWLIKTPTDWSQWRYLITGYMNWPPTLFFLAIVGYSAAAYFQFSKTRSHYRKNQGMSVLLLVIGMALLVIYPFTPFSGTYNEAHGSLQVLPRYLIAPFLIGLLLFACLMENAVKWRKFCILLVLLAVVTPYKMNIFTVGRNIIVIVIALLILLIWEKWKTLRASLPIHPLILLGCFSVVLVVLAVQVPVQQRFTNQALYQYESSSHPVGKVWEVLETLPSGSIIAPIGPRANQYYPIFGRQLQFLPQCLNSQGDLYKPLHQRWLQDPEHTRWWSQTQPLPPEKVGQNLLNSGVDYLIVIKCEREEWKSVEPFLSASERAWQIYDDGYACIWKFSA